MMERGAIGYEQIVLLENQSCLGSAPRGAHVIRIVLLKKH
jgi:hypothetical protein